MSSIRLGFLERPRLAILWTVAILLLIAGAYFGTRALVGSGDDEIAGLRSDLAESAAARAQATERLAQSEARSDGLTAALNARDRRIKALRRKVAELQAQPVAAGSAANPPPGR